VSTRLLIGRERGGFDGHGHRHRIRGRGGLSSAAGFLALDSKEVVNSGIGSWIGGICKTLCVGEGVMLELLGP